MNDIIRKHEVAKEMIEYAEKRFFDAMTFYNHMKWIKDDKGKVSSIHLSIYPFSLYIFYLYL